jgi:exodeoxyribonuclease VII small subunit
MKKIEEMEYTLEEAMRRLDEVAQALDRENRDLEQALRLYEEGVRLVAFCQKKLEDAERKIRMLKVSDEGELCEIPFAEHASGEER